MSRHVFRGLDPRYRLIAGWDRPLGTYFAQVEDLAWRTEGCEIDEDAPIGDTPEEGLVLWVGAHEIVENVERIVEALSPYGSVPDSVVEQLKRDRVL